MLRDSRQQIARRSDLSGSERRALLTAETDRWLLEVFAKGLSEAGASEEDFCLVAVGGYGRAEMSLGSDVDLLLLHQDHVAAFADVAASIWYPIWDSGISLDHSVRTVAQARDLARSDYKVVLGLLDARPIAGNASLAKELRSHVLADWRAGARLRLPELHAAVVERRERVGDLAQLLEPDLKDAYGGLRDAVVLRSLAASWMVEMPRTGWTSSVETLLDIRDALHARGSRDRLTMHDQYEIAQELSQGSAQAIDADELLRSVYFAGRDIAHVSDMAWHRALRAVARGSAAGQRTPLAEGVVLADGEVALARTARPAEDHGLALRAAAAAAQQSTMLSPTCVDRLAAALPDRVEWTTDMRQSLVSLLGSGPDALVVFEALDQAGIIATFIPEWSAVRSLPQRNALHEFTVDRHLLQTAVHARARLRDVDRPDLLLIAALLHDIGKGYPGDHSIVGAEIAREIVTRMGFADHEVEVVQTLVRHHLLLPDVATRRDLDDPATIDGVVASITSVGTLELLHALTWADSQATGPTVRTPWRRQLISELVAKCRARLEGTAVPEVQQSPELSSALEETGETTVRIIPGDDDCTIVVSTFERMGILAIVAGVLSLHRLEIRQARIQTRGDRAAQEWTVRPLFGDLPDERAIASDIRAAINQDLDIAERLAKRSDQRATSSLMDDVKVWVDNSPLGHTAVEVRSHDEPALLYRITSALVATDAVVWGAKIDTLGSEVVDSFFVTDRLGQSLSDEHMDAVRATVLATLSAR